MKFLNFKGIAPIIVLRAGIYATLCLGTYGGCLLNDKIYCLIRQAKLPNVATHIESIWELYNRIFVPFTSAFVSWVPGT